MENSIDRWVILLRHKAGEYEHTARKKGEPVSSPSIDEICNEMLAFGDAVAISRKR